MLRYIHLPSSSNPGLGEIDTFISGSGRDLIILGDTTWIGYAHVNSSFSSQGVTEEVLNYDKLFYRNWLD